MQRITLILLICNILRSSPHSLSAATQGDASALTVSPTVLTALFEQARNQNSGLRAAEARVTAGRLGADTVRTWEDPRFTFGGVLSGPRRGRIEEDGDLIYGVDQKLPLWDRPRLSRAILLAETQTQATEAAAREAQVRRDLAKALLRLALVHRTTSFLTNDLAWVEMLIAIGEEKFRAGAGSHTDLLQLQNERSKRTDALRTEQNRLRAEHAALNRLLGRDLQSPWPRVELPRLAPPVVYSPALANYVATNEPRLKVLRQEKAQAEAVTRLTATMCKPDVSFGIQGRQYSGDAGFREGTLTLSLNLPWWNLPKYRADLRRDEAKVRTIEAEMTDYELNVREEVLRLTLATDTAHREAVLYRDEIQQRAQQAVASFLNMWQVNQGQLRDILDARRTLLDAQLMQDRAIIEQHQMFVELAALCDLPDYFQLPRLLVQLGSPSHSHPPSTLSDK